MATTRLKSFQARLFGRLAAEVEYQPFVENPANVNQTTREIIDDEAAYPTSVTLQALIDYQPTEASRHALGLKEDVDAMLTILASDCEERGVTITTKDRFQLQGKGPFYVTKVAANQQSGDEHLSYAVALVRTAGGHRNR